MNRNNVKHFIEIFIGILQFPFMTTPAATNQ